MRSADGGLPRDSRLIRLRMDPEGIEESSRRSRSALTDAVSGPVLFDPGWGRRMRRVVLRPPSGARCVRLK